jgi:hypothetical protein
MFLQGGSIATGWVGHVSEIQWTEDGDDYADIHTLHRDNR